MPKCFSTPCVRLCALVRALGLCLTFVACGADTLAISASLVTLPGDAALQDVVSLEVILGDERGNVLEQRGPIDEVLTLPRIDETQTLRIEITGRDLQNAVVSRGQTNLSLAGVSGACCANVCLCSVIEFDAGRCTCGSAQCETCP